MSTQIYYEMVVARIPGDFFGSLEDMFIQLTLDGSSNTYCGDKRVRRWHIESFGNREEIIANAIAHAKYFDNGCSRWKSNGASGYITAQQWIRKVRTAVDKAAEWNPELWGVTFGQQGTISLSGLNELAGKDQADIVRFFYNLIIDASRDMSRPLQFFEYVRVNGPGTV